MPCVRYMTPRAMRSSVAEAALPLSRMDTDMTVSHERVSRVIAMGHSLTGRVCKHIGSRASFVCMTANEGTLTVADLPLILALSRERTLAGAAERLDVDLSTVFRRLNALETRLRVRLFDRSPRGYQLTSAGERAASAAERVETELLTLDREISGRDQQL